MAKGNSKQVKLQPKHRELSRGYKIVPWLSVSGVWLEKLGFKVGDTVNIIIREKLLVIEHIEPLVKPREAKPKKP
ncbi:SymE family type I addiction module toxin [Flavobacterium sp. PL02]|uniref:SymE family type I addiction module toxin n=1 Tax=Flavobacterium sp. PL02 TaxID=3088354 RepID=UPI002B2326FE|nr:SymE family type I addiction module toxin [Flavobacterium sp. PL02]MEA9414158.1 SymE family type I addiction module toxin [Flavobacterium sp. PL02]MEA9414164.1 SymE family type I addiction module toxin [Flavobacterium sp. PL02]